MKKLVLLLLTTLPLLIVGQTTSCVPTLFIDIAPGGSGSFPANFLELSGAMYFSAANSIWRSDGTVSGTVALQPTPSVSISTTGTPNWVVMGDQFYFANGFLTSNSLALWKSDGTDEGTSIVKSFPNAYLIYNLVTVNDLVYFIVQEQEFLNGTRKLWRSDGTEAGTFLVKDIDPSNNPNYFPERLYGYENRLYFFAGTASFGNELWSSDGTEAGTAMVKDLNQGASGSINNSPTRNSYAVLSDGLYFFRAAGLIMGLWRTDGTEAGTVLVKSTGSISDFKTIDDVMFFTAFDSEGASSTSLYGRELWRSDGTEAGTFMIKDILPGSGGSIYSLNEYTAYNGKVLFGANDGSTGDELWETDGTEAGTQLLKDIRVGNLSGNPFLPHAKIFNELCYFTATDGANNMELWKTDGTEAGTQQVGTINPSGSSSPTELFVFNDLLFFQANDGVHGNELWACGDFTSSAGENLRLTRAISVYPNPTVNDLFITDVPIGATVRVLDGTGRLVHTTQAEADPCHINTSGFVTGVYFVHIVSGTVSTSKTFIVNR